VPAPPIPLKKRESGGTISYDKLDKLK